MSASAPTFTIHCPHCRNLLSVATSQAGQVATCPHCRGGLSVPVFAAPTPEQTPVIEEPAFHPSRWRYVPKSAGGNGPLIAAAVGILLVCVAGATWFVISNARDKADREKLNQIRMKADGLRLDLQAMQIKMGATGMDSPHHEFSRDPAYMAKLSELNEAVFEHNQILDSHPTWSTPRLDLSLKLKP